MFEMLALLAALSCGSGCTTEATVQTTTTEDQVTDNMPTYIGPTKQQQTPKEENPHDGCKYCQ